MKSFRVLLTAAIVVGVSFASSVRAETAGTPGQNDLVIAGGGKAPATVVVAANAGKWEARAATDLAHYIGLMTGARVPVARSAAAIAQALNGQGAVLVVGEEALRVKPELRRGLAAVAKKQPVLRADALVIVHDGNRVYLAGLNDQCHYYAVAGLLHAWGCEWYIPTEFGECVPTCDVLKVGDLDVAYAPPFEVRTYWISWVGDTSGREEFMNRNMMTLGVGVPSGHSLGRYVKEFVPKGKSVFNIPISDPSTAAHVAKKVENLYAEGKYFSLGMEDGIYSSDSPRDKKLMALRYDKYFMRPSVTDAFMEFYNNVARILEKKYPNSKAKIGFLAYSNMTIPPVHKIVAEKPLVAYLAPIDIDPIHGMDDPRSLPRREYKDILYGWAKVMQGRVVIYDYDQGMLVWRDIPNPSIQSFRQDVKHYRQAGILGVDTESRNAIGTTFINLHIRARLLWEPDVDLDACLAAFYPKFFGPTAVPMSKYWTAIYNAWANTIATEHEFFVAPAIYTPELMAQLRARMSEAEKLIQPLETKKNPTRNEKLYVARMKFMRLSFGILDAYTRMTAAAATDCDYKVAADAGAQGLATRERLTNMSGIFTTYRRYPEHGYAWWPGEVKQYRELLQCVDGAKGTLLMKLPLTWAFRRDPDDRGVKEGWATAPVDLTWWNGLKDAGSIESHMKNPGNWEMARTDLYLQAQGVLHANYDNYNGHAWYRTDVTLKPADVARAVHIRFPGLFNECWLYVNGKEVAHRKQRAIWWYNDYRFEWDVDLSGALKPGANVLALRIDNPHHMGGMFRRPFLHVAKK